MEPLNENIEDLIADKLSGQITSEDDELLGRLIAQDERIRKQWEDSLALVSFYKAVHKAEEIDDDKAWESLVSKIETKEVPVSKIAFKSFDRKWFVAAGLLVPLLLAALWFGLFKSNKQFGEKHAKQKEFIEVTLGDGSTYTLEGNKEINTGEIRFDSKSAQHLGEKGKVRKNEIITLSIPKGKTYAVVLDDGTSIKINSASILKFPLFFEGNTREIQLDGEAYFEVAKQKSKPFIVKTSEMNVKVLGTKFNVNTYPGNDAQASLVEGSVSVSGHASTKEFLIKPGYAAIKRSNGAILAEPFATDQVLSWLQGTYYFNNMPLREIVNITNRATGEDLYITDSKIANYRFSGALETDKPIKVLLENIKSSSSSIQYTVKDGRVELY